MSNYEESALAALALSYQRWCDENGYQPLSMDEQPIQDMPREDAIILSQFTLLWESLSK